MTNMSAQATGESMTDVKIQLNVNDRRKQSKPEHVDQ